jgi:hypothetical protein
MNNLRSIDALVRLAARLRKDRQFMAYVLDAYQKQENISDEELANELDTIPPMVLRLALCKRPDGNSPDFSERVRRLAAQTLSDEVKLAEILRQVGALEELSASRAAGLLAAARDRTEPTKPRRTRTTRARKAN